MMTAGETQRVDTRAGEVVIPKSLDSAAAAMRHGVQTLVNRLNYSYQLKYLADRSLRKFALFSRQTGKTRTIAEDHSLEAVSSPGLDCVIVSASENQVYEVLRDVEWWSNIWDDLARSVLGRSIYKKAPTATDIEYWNGSRVLSRNANPRTAVGYTGPVTLDEASKIMHDEEMFDALSPITSSGPFPFRMSGTPWGARGVFWKVCTGQIPGWSGHVVTIHDAVKMGCPRDVEDLRTQHDSLKFAQEFECRFLSRLLSPFTPDFLRMCADLDLPACPPIGHRLPDGKIPRYAIGVDVGRTNDRTDIIFGCEWPAGHYQVTAIDHMRGVSFEDQFNALKPWLDNPGIERMGIDATGLGMQLAEDLYKHNPAKVTQVHFSNQSKNAMMELALARMSQGKVKVLSDSDLQSDLGSIERKVLPSGTVTYQAPRTEKGHGDAAFAFIIWLAQLADVQGQFLFDIGYGTDMVAGEDAYSTRDGSLGLFDGMGRKAIGLLPENPLAAFLAPSTSDMFTREEIAAMSDEEKIAYGLLESGPLFTLNPPRQGPGGYGMEIIDRRY
jgi:phage FluMu gp28-like protein